ncbi:hypothetical protein EM595_0048 [Duffyella gerundensis]|uniref:Uncharacterized protein n=1 Tax=Duffyella gerundensis TaxID=1619313 RepID=A0A0U5E5H4_9GAMM|nr:hypothetical protein EM595_0048 [Duffyella gerundensis]
MRFCQQYLLLSRIKATCHVSKHAGLIEKSNFNRSVSASA